jgi:hypothetical protein
VDWRQVVSDFVNLLTQPIPDWARGSVMDIMRKCNDTSLGDEDRMWLLRAARDVAVATSSNFDRVFPVLEEDSCVGTQTKARTTKARLQQDLICNMQLKLQSQPRSSSTPKRANLSD